MTQWDPLRFSQSGDALILDGIASPLAELTKIQRVHRMKKIEPYGAIGARIIGLGRYLYEFTVRIRLTTEADWDLWNGGFRDAVERLIVGPKSRAQSLIYAPLAARGVFQVLVEKVVGPLPDGETGAWVVDIDFSEWLPMQKRAMAAPQPAKQDKSTDPYDRVIEQLSEQFRSRVNG